MEGLKCKSLPVEILCRIFRQERAEHLYHYALVCKAWVFPVQTALYSKVEIETLSRLKKFHNIVKEKPQLGEKVKILILKEFWNIGEFAVTQEEIDNIITALLTIGLPKLEELTDEYTNSYTPTLNALQDSGLKYLKRLESPVSLGENRELDNNYAACALLMKDRIERLKILEENELYNKLDQFSKLVELELADMPTNDEIQVLEYITGNCKSLKNLRFSFSSADDQLENNSVSNEAILGVTPSNDVKKVDATVTLTRDYRTLLYLMHKFPQVHNMKIDVSYHSSALLDRDILTQLLDHSFKIESFDASGMKGNDDVFCGVFGEYWNAKPTPGGELVEITYANYISENDPYELCITNKRNSVKTNFFFPNIESNAVWKHTNFIQKNGKYIGELLFTFDLDDDDDVSALPDNFIVHTFTHCPNLRILHLKLCSISHLSTIESHNRISLDELYLDRCCLNSDALEQFSLSLRKLRRLCVNNPSFAMYSSDDEDYMSINSMENLEIVMPHTEIDIILLDECDSSSPTYIKLLVASIEEYYYYRYDGKISLSNEKEYTRDEYQERTYVCCQNKPQFQFFKNKE